MVKFLKIFIKKRLPKKRPKRKQPNKKRHKSNKLKMKSSTIIKRIEDDVTKINSISQPQEIIFETEDEVIFNELDILENDSNEIKDLSFLNVQNAYINDSSYTKEKII